MFNLVSDQADFVVIHKSAGVSVHKDQEEIGLVTAIEQTLNTKLWLVHRLDKMTSGLLLLAKHQQAASELSQLFAQRSVNKFYLAISDAKPSKKQGRIMGDMEKSRRGGWRLTPTRENPAITDFVSHSIKPGLRAFLCKPRTGQTHQIRVALKSIGAPIVGDPTYNRKSLVTADRGYLHAWQLAFDYGGKTYRFMQPPIEGALFTDSTSQAVLDEWKDPFSLPWKR